MHTGEDVATNKENEGRPIVVGATGIETSIILFYMHI
jgi:hypothetical protein